ncbi:hypothetical protein PV327_002654 [Microctonus hyperodae]|uniref:WH1 domain-containing protein n=1 Tax=Microctonus hyperodae TaxID=165561 RepID=A0AA39KPF4_MICHY|nr:hypothetical protein PV327_002654 [Microctonus hyperodae]
MRRVSQTNKRKTNSMYLECQKGQVTQVNPMSSQTELHVRPITVHGDETMRITEDDKCLATLMRQQNIITPRLSSWQGSLECEVSISSARASVMVYDDVNKRWVPSGSSSGLSKVQLWHHVVHNTFRVVGRKLQDHEIVINCAILKGLKYNQATVTFHQWRDNNQVYGLNFSSKDDADAFARAMLQALDVLSNGSNISRSLVPTGTPAGQQPVYTQQPPQQQQQQPQLSQGNTQYEEDMGYRTMTREDVAIIQERRMSQQSQGSSNGPNAISPSCPSVTQQQTQQQPQQQQQQQQQSGHHRTSSAPPAPQPQPQPPPMPGTMIAAKPQIPGPPVPPPQPPLAPPAPPCPPSMMNFNAPVPPPMMNQYAQSPSQTNLSNQSSAQSVYGSTQSNQFANNTNQTQYSSQNSLYGNNNSSNYGQNNAAPGNQFTNSQNSSQYPANQYGSSNSINQYASSPNQYGQGQTGQYGVVNQPQGQYSQSGNATVNPYGTPTSTVNQYPSGPTANANTYAPIGSGGPPPPPMGPLGGPAAPPPPPPPPVPNTNNAGSNNNNVTPNIEPQPDANSLAAALQARLKKKQQSQPVENSGSSTSSSGSGGGGGNYGTLGRGAGGGMASMMDEMAKTLARRRAAVEKKQPEQPPEPESSPDKKSWDKSNSTNNKFSNGGGESPKSARKRFGSASEDTLLRVNGVNEGALLTAQEMEAFKVEIIKEVRKEFAKMKTEIVEALKGDLNRR